MRWIEYAGFFFLSLSHWLLSFRVRRTFIHYLCVVIFGSSRFACVVCRLIEFKRCSVFTANNGHHWIEIKDHYIAGNEDYPSHFSLFVLLPFYISIYRCFCAVAIVSNDLHFEKYVGRMSHAFALISYLCFFKNGISHFVWGVLIIFKNGQMAIQWLFVCLSCSSLSLSLSVCLSQRCKTKNKLNKLKNYRSSELAFLFFSFLSLFLCADFTT